MNKMKSMFFVLIGVIIAVAVMGIAFNLTKKDIGSQNDSQSSEQSSVSTEEITDEEEEDIEIKQPFVFMEMNYKEDAVEGSLIDCFGQRYSVRLEGVDEEISPEEFYVQARSQYLNSDPEQLIPQSDIKMLYKKILYINSNFGYEISDEKSDDEYALYCIRKIGTEEFIEVYYTGEYTELPTGKDIREIYNYFMDLNGQPGRKLSVEEPEESVVSESSTKDRSDTNKKRESSVAAESSAPEVIDYRDGTGKALSD